MNSEVICGQFWRTDALTFLKEEVSLRASESCWGSDKLGRQAVDKVNFVPELWDLWATGQRLTKGGVVCSCAGGSVWHQHGGCSGTGSLHRNLSSCNCYPVDFPFWPLPKQTFSSFLPQTGSLFSTASRFVSELPSMALMPNSICDLYKSGISPGHHLTWMISLWSGGTLFKGFSYLLSHLSFIPSLRTR